MGSIPGLYNTVVLHLYFLRTSPQPPENFLSPANQLPVGGLAVILKLLRLLLNSRTSSVPELWVLYCAVFIKGKI